MCTTPTSYSGSKRAVSAFMTGRGRPSARPRVPRMQPPNWQELAGPDYSVAADARRCGAGDRPLRARKGACLAAPQPARRRRGAAPGRQLRAALPAGLSNRRRWAHHVSPCSPASPPRLPWLSSLRAAARQRGRPAARAFESPSGRGTARCPKFRRASRQYFPGPRRVRPPPADAARAAAPPRRHARIPLTPPARRPGAQGARWAGARGLAREVVTSAGLGPRSRREPSHTAFTPAWRGPGGALAGPRAPPRPKTC